MGLSFADDYGIPLKMSYQGILTDSEGNLVPDGTYTIGLELREWCSDVNNPGSGDATESSSYEVSVINGMFNTIMDFGSSIDGFVNGPFCLATYFLGEGSGGSWGDPMVPLTLLTTVPYSFNAFGVKSYENDGNVFPQEGFVGIGQTAADDMDTNYPDDLALGVSGDVQFEGGIFKMQNGLNIYDYGSMTDFYNMLFYANVDEFGVNIPTVFFNRVEDAGDNFFIVNLDAYFTGSINYESPLLAYSDINQKKNITTLSGSLDKVLNLRGVSFNWKDPSKGEDIQFGLIAQEVEEVFPELVAIVDKEDDTKGIRYVRLIVPMIEAMKELNAKNDALQAQNAELTKRLERLESAVFE